MSTGITPDETPKKIQTTFRADEKTYKRMHSEAVKREISIQEMILNALKIYWRTPREWDYAQMNFITHDEGKMPEEEVSLRNHWVGLWIRYVNKMPREKVEMAVKALEWDLRMKRSSRAHSASRSRRKEN